MTSDLQQILESKHAFKRLTARSMAEKLRMLGELRAHALNLRTVSASTQPTLMKIDEVGYWSELKLEIIRKYAAVYSAILAQVGRTRRCSTCISMPLPVPACTSRNARASSSRAVH